MRTSTIDLDKNPSTIASCIRLELLDGTVYGFTDHDEDIEVDGERYEARFGGETASIENYSNLQEGNTESDVLLDVPGGVSTNDVVRGRFDDASVTLFWVDYEDGGTMTLVEGKVGKATPENNRVRLEFVSLSNALNKTVVEVMTPYCRAELGDSRCKVNLDNYRVSGTIDGVETQLEIADSSRNEGDGYFTLGLITFTSGDNEGVSMEVRQHTSDGKIVLFEPFPFEVKVGDEYDMVPGCDKTYDTCINKYDNIINFQGEPFVPGDQKLEQVGGVNT